jgi:hypothetical protein
LIVTETKPHSVIKLLDYQRKLVLDESRFICGRMGRGTRKTWTGTLKAVRKIMHREAAGGRNTCIIASRGERQSLVAIAFAKQHAKAYSLAINTVTEERELTNEFGVRVLDESGFVIKYKVHTVTFPNGSQIIGVPANPDTLRGYTGDLLLDEFAFHKDSRAIWGAVFPIIRDSHDLLILSTPNGKSNKFYEISTLADPVWSQHVVTIVDAVNQGLPFNLDQQRRALNDDDLWQQEYMLEWLDEANSWLDYDLINSVEAEGAGDPRLYADGLCYSGEDIGLRRDLWVMWVLEKVGDVLWTREIRTLKRAQFIEHDRTARRTIRQIPNLAPLHGSNRHGRKARGGCQAPPRRSARRRCAVHDANQIAARHGRQNRLPRQKNSHPDGRRSPSRRPAQTQTRDHRHRGRPVCGRQRQQRPRRPRLGLLSSHPRRHRPAHALRLHPRRPKPLVERR